jgi:hypothetical protein
LDVDAGNGRLKAGRGAALSRAKAQNLFDLKIKLFLFLRQKANFFALRLTGKPPA